MHRMIAEILVVIKVIIEYLIKRLPSCMGKVHWLESTVHQHWSNSKPIWCCCLLWECELCTSSFVIFPYYRCNT